MTTHFNPLHLEPIKYPKEDILHDGLIKAIQKTRSPKAVDRSLDKRFGWSPKAKYPDYPL
jgi:hypothetical protein